MDNKKHYWLYVLKLEAGKYYVGITTKSPAARYKEHESGYYGAAWTRRYKPKSIHYQKDLGVTDKSRAEQFENKVVRRYIQTYGIKNVRGGDIRFAEDLVIKFGWWWSKKDWEALVTITALLLVLLLLIGAYLLKQ